MAADLSEHVFNEKQLYTGDVLGEDGDDNRPVLLPDGSLAAAPCRSGTSGGGGSPSLAFSSLFHSAATPTSAGSLANATLPLLAPASGAVSSPGVADSTTTGAGGPFVVGSAPSVGRGTVAGAVGVGGRRRKRNTARATQIIYLLESKYDLLHEVCASFENWKEAASTTCDFDLLWSDTAISADRFMKLKPYQKMNHFVGMSSITRKNNLGRNLLRMRKQFPKEYRFFPDTWILPTDLSDFKLQFTPAKNKTFIIKPDNGCQGKGIFLIRDVEKVPVDFSTTYVAQRYVHRPFLLDGYKFDLRLYALVVGCDPLRIFLHRRGLVRLASEPYVEPSTKNLSSAMVHLTNYAINKMNPNFEENKDPEDAKDGHKRSWEAVADFLRREGHDVDALQAEIEDLIIKTLISVQPSLSHFYHSCQPEDIENAMAFEVLGFDVILDHKLQPWLLEVNHAPSFAAESELDRVVKQEVLHDTFSLLRLCPETRRQKKREAREKMEQRAMGVAKKQPIEDRLTLEQDIARRRTQWEDANCNGYKRLYPSEEKERQYMAVHDAAVSIWEMLMGGTSRRCVRLTDRPPEGDTDGDGADKEKRVRKSAAEAAGKQPSETGATTTTAAAKRTPEEIREVVERLMNGCSARPRASRIRRGRSKDVEEGAASLLAAGPGEEDAVASPEQTQSQLEDASGGYQTQQQQSVAVSSKPKIEPQVGDVIKVQTNLGWESVVVRAKRTNGKLDIQFKDGEYMRSVLPRILREQSGAPCLAGSGSSSSSSAPCAVQGAGDAGRGSTESPVAGLNLAGAAATAVAAALSANAEATSTGKSLGGVSAPTSAGSLVVDASGNSTTNGCGASGGPSASSIVASSVAVGAVCVTSAGSSATSSGVRTAPQAESQQKGVNGANASGIDEVVNFGIPDRRTCVTGKFAGQPCTLRYSNARW